MKHTVLVVDDEAAARELIADFLEGRDYDVILADTGTKALELFDRRSPELSILDLNLPGVSGMELLNQFKTRDPGHPVIIVSADAALETAVKAMKLGACEYLCKPANLESLKLAVEKAFNESRLQRTLSYLVNEKEQEFRQGTVIGDSPVMKAVMETVQKVAVSPASTVLVTGESGTGKEVIAKAIHYFSPQRHKPFLEINCTAVPETLMESELFGHERGAFTDAKTRKQGLLELADGGTFFLDEIGEMPLSLQAKLLRVIEDRSFRRVGGVKNFQVDLRIIAATNADLARRVEEGRFRADLYYRLNVIAIYLPPLKERGDDIHLLAGHFLDYFNRAYRRDVKGFNEEAERLLQAYPWPGNVRELRNAVERAVMISSGGYITPRDLNIERRGQARDLMVTTPSGHPLLSLPEAGVGLDQIEKEAILAALNRCGWNVCKAARFLKISRQTLRYRMARHGLTGAPEMASA
ncbi:MAG: sigma-54-dependent Fis family transcriptional regulator [Candidatus Zixiibacteriota bacterium]|nr:MAG: sigma-54-dependent Fis family transcriptional regulator [candidate division Zixibacteria bacterium]